MAKEMETETKATEKAGAAVNPNTPQKETESARKRGRPSSVMRSQGPIEAATVDYERYREERIKENRERMQKLLDLSHSMRTVFSAPDSNPNPKRKTFLADSERKGSQKRVILEPPVPTRRSSRLQNAAPVSYTEIHTKKGRDLSEDGDAALIEEGRREEIYTEEHDKLLGSCKSPWTLFVDGYGKDGKRVYDQARGKTCHQCRQKTMGHRTSCCKCQLVQGQFCGDCLYMRYGENVLEAQKNPNWTCPACRGICNCSLCRVKKGWNPTGVLYKRIVNLGYKSVAHYLIQTHRTPAHSNEQLPSETEGNTLGHTEPGTENLVKSELKGTKESGSIVEVSSDESTTGVPQKGDSKGTPPVDSFSPGPVSSRLRRRQKA